MGRIILLLLLTAMLNPPKAASQLHFKAMPDSIAKKPLLLPVPQIFYTPPTGFFCKKEVQMQKQLKIPLFIRIGSKEYVDRLEKKGTGIGGQGLSGQQLILWKNMILRPDPCIPCYLLIRLRRHALHHGYLRRPPVIIISK